jgi:hypothetical protein
MRVGGVRWTVNAPSGSNGARSLFCPSTNHKHFRSRHAWAVLLFELAEKRQGEHAKKL